MGTLPDNDPRVPLPRAIQRLFEKFLEPRLFEEALAPSDHGDASHSQVFSVPDASEFVAYRPTPDFCLTFVGRITTCATEWSLPVCSFRGVDYYINGKDDASEASILAPAWWIPITEVTSTEPASMQVTSRTISHAPMLVWGQYGHNT